MAVGYPAPMKCLSFVMSMFLLAGLAGAAGPDDQYIEIYTLIREADALVATEPHTALERYTQAQTFLQRFQKGNPAWNAPVVRFRLAYLAQQIAATSGKLRPAEIAPAVTPPAVAAGASNPPPVSPPVNNQAELEDLRARTRQLESDKALLEAKLREALSAMPAAVDPKELAGAEERIRKLQKENELLRVSRELEKDTPAKVPDTSKLRKTQEELDAVNRTLASETERTRQLMAENGAIKKRLEELGRNTAPLDAARIQKAVDGANRELSEQKQVSARLALEKQSLQSRVVELQAAVDKAAGLRQENEKHLERIQKLEEELGRKASAVAKESTSRRERALAKNVAELERQVSTYQSRLAVLEARPVPFKPEELALFKAPPPTLPRKPAGIFRSRDLPRVSANLVAEAGKQFSSKQYEKAEASLQEAARQPQPNVEVLTKLAATQLAQGRLDEADKTLQQALTAAPEDAAGLHLTGVLRYQQGNMDQAVDALSRAAKRDTRNAETQNYLGLALSRKGMRLPAETALRKALEIQPGYASAHYNLAVIYLAQQPPSAELARWHYQKAVASGHPRNADLEKTLENRTTAK